MQTLHRREDHGAQEGGGDGGGCGGCGGGGTRRWTPYRQITGARERPPSAEATVTQPVVDRATLRELSALAVGHAFRRPPTALNCHGTFDVRGVGWRADAGWWHALRP